MNYNTLIPVSQDKLVQHLKLGKMKALKEINIVHTKVFFEYAYLQ